MSEEIFVINKLKTKFQGHIINDLNGEEIMGTFYEKELQKTDQQKFRIEKLIKRTGKKLYSNGKVMMVHLIAGLIKMLLNKIPCIKINDFLNHMSLLE